MTLLCQQDELYAAEREVPRGREFSDAEEIQGYVDALREEPWWPEPVRRVEVYDRLGEESIGGWHPEKAAGLMELADCHYWELFVLHELAHVLAEERYGSRAHDPGFARTYFELVYRVMGSDTYHALFMAFEDHGVDHEAWGY